MGASIRLASWDADVTRGPVAVRDAATVMLVRDGDTGPEVFMLRRHLDSAFVGGAYVFPGGAVDPADRHADLEPVCVGRSEADASRALGIEAGGLAFWVAAIRECFEEAGVLLARSSDGEIVRFDDPDVADRFGRHRRSVHAGELALVAMCRDEGLVLDTGGVHYFAHWITPEGEPRRYDTRFFVARAPAAQDPLHDDHETIASLWVRPADALDRHRAGELMMILPTIRNLQALARFDSVDDLLAAAASATAVPTVQPRIVRDGEGLRVLLPGDEGYDEVIGSVRVAGGPLPGQPGGPAID